MRNDIDNLFRDFGDLLRGGIQGNLDRYLFFTPEEVAELGGAAPKPWMETVLNSSYYLYKDDTSLIQSNADAIVRAWPDTAQIIDLGPGDENAVRGKTVPLLKAHGHVSHYHCVDLHSTFVEDAKELVSDNFPELNITGEAVDFFDSSRVLDIAGNIDPVVVFLFGNTLFNIPQHASGPTFIELLSWRLEALKTLIPAKKFKLIVTHDTNQNVETLIRAYSEIEFDKEMILMIKLMEPYYPGLDENGFKFVCEFQESDHLLQCGLEVTEKQSVNTPKGDISLEIGRRLFMNSSYKIPAKVFIPIAESCGFQSELVIHEAEHGRMALHVLNV